MKDKKWDMVRLFESINKTKIKGSLNEGFNDDPIGHEADYEAMKKINSTDIDANKPDNKLPINPSVRKLSTVGLLSIFRDHPEIHLDGQESRQELEEILQLNLDNDDIDEFEVINVLDGEDGRGDQGADPLAIKQAWNQVLRNNPYFDEE